MRTLILRKFFENYKSIMRIGIFSAKIRKKYKEAFL